jgi:hypothetical protein
MRCFVMCDVILYCRLPAGRLRVRVDNWTYSTFATHNYKQLLKTVKVSLIYTLYIITTTAHMKSSVRSLVFAR